MDSKSPTNWCDIPMELRAECIKWLDFKSRMMLRATSHTEKSLVESVPKYHFEFVEISWGSDCYLYMGSLPENERGEEMMCMNRNECYQSMIQVLNYGKAHCLSIDMKFERDDDADQFIADISNGAPFRFHKFKLFTVNPKVAQFLLRNSKFEELKLGRLSDCDGQFLLQDFIDIPAVVNNKSLTMLNKQTPDDVFMLIEKWIEKDVEAGCFLQCSVDANHPLLYEIGEKFKDRIIEEWMDDEPSGWFRIRTDNESKRISFNFYLVIESEWQITCRMIEA